MEPFAERRRLLLERLDGAVAVLASAPVALRNNDVEHEYRQDSDLYYLTGFDEPEAVLVVAPRHAEHRFVLFVRPRDPERETWDGARAGVEGAVARYGADAAFPIAELDAKLPDYLSGHERMICKVGRDGAFDAHVFRALDRARARGRNGSPWPTEIVDPSRVVHEMRLVKSEAELATMREAAVITREGHEGAMRLAAPGMYEYEVEALLRDVFRRRGCERHAYAPIVGSGPNATVLHYHSNDRKMEAGDLLLIDAGCELRYYASDVTRTFPVSGTFSPAQRAIYQLVLDAELASIDAVRPGATVDDVHARSVDVIVDGLLALGLLAGDREKILADQTYKRFFMHRTSHWLGMDVHDVGAYHLGGEPRALAPGMVLTVEPGIYISPGDTEVPEAYRGIGVRIEDDVCVTASGGEVLTADIPKTVEDVERACAG